MTAPRVRSAPLSAAGHSATRRHRGVTASTMLIVYLALLFVVPSYVTIAPLGSLGRPSLLWGLVLAFWWVLSRLQQRAHDAEPVTQLVRLALGMLIVVVLLSFAAAMLRGQPADQVSPAVTALVRLASWSGVLLVAMDGVRTPTDAARLVRSLAIAGGAMAALGLAQFLTGQTLLEWITSIPGLGVDSGTVATRGAYTRASGTATHPLEYGTAVVAMLPPALAAAVTGGFRRTRRAGAGWWWLPTALIIAASLMAVSRSAIIGLAVALLASLPAVPRSYRGLIAVGGGVLAAAVLAVVPGMLGTIVSLFAGASDDPSTQSRTAAVARVPEFIASSPLVGQGFGTFLPRYYIFDNAWVLLTVELGVAGLLACGFLVVSGIGSAVWASRHSPFGDMDAMAKALAASATTIATLLLFFDGLSFPISAGLLFLVVGLCAATRTIAAADGSLADASRRLAVLARDDEASAAPTPKSAPTA